MDAGGARRGIRRLWSQPADYRTGDGDGSVLFHAAEFAFRQRPEHGEAEAIDAGGACAVARLAKLLRSLEDALTGVVWKDDKLFFRYGPGTGRERLDPASGPK